MENNLNEVSWDRIRAALEGELQARQLTEAERRVVHAKIAARIRAGVTSAAFGEQLLAQGKTAISTDPDGRLVEHYPDGRIVFLREM